MNTENQMLSLQGHSRNHQEREAKMPRLVPKHNAANTEAGLPSSSVSLPCSPSDRESAKWAPFILNRELSWLEFNKRVLNEADDDRNPLLERVKFLAIADSNIDDFYMKRIGGLKQQVGAGITDPSVDGRTPAQQISECIREINAFHSRAGEIHIRVMSLLAKEGIRVRGYETLTQMRRETLNKMFAKEILPLITPLPIDANRPLPFISNLSLNLLVEFAVSGRKNPVLARIKIPDGKVVPRFVKIGQEHDYVLIEDIIVNNLGVVFPSMKVIGFGLFRITRNAISDMDTADANDLLEVIEEQLRTRKFAPVLRLQTSTGISLANRRNLAQKLGLPDGQDVFENETMLGVKDLMELAGIDATHLLHEPHQQLDNAQLPADVDIFSSIRLAGSVLVQHPYESFVTSVKRLVREASTDPRVLSIKMSLYRTSADTKIIDYLINAVRDGKQVAVVVELQARNDEAANIEWASRLVQAGVHVNYGVLGLKTHCKTILIVRQEKDGLRRYAHFGTGNYHAGTARLYSDVGLLTCEEELVSDLTELFNHLSTRWGSGNHYSHLLVAPFAIKTALLAKIDREISLHSADTPGIIRFKTNALEDVDIVRALYRASQAGVKVELLVRDICRLRPGIKDLSENITVISIVGRFLEHSRIFYFRNGGNEEYFIGSADLMSRNLERRVEVIVPIRDETSRHLLKTLLENQLHDNRNGWEMNGAGRYVQRRPATGRSSSCSHEMAIRGTAARKAGTAKVASVPQSSASLECDNTRISCVASSDKGGRHDRR